jgi:hypothetical protein
MQPPLPGAELPTPRIPDPLRGRLFDEVHRTWADAARARQPDHPPFHLALGALAVWARAHRVPVAQVLAALTAVIQPEEGGTTALDWDHVREIAGKVVIANYYRDD